MNKGTKKQRSHTRVRNHYGKIAIDQTLLVSITKNVAAKEREYLDAVEAYISRMEDNPASHSSSKGLAYLLLQWNANYPTDSFIYRLYQNPYSVLFLYNLIPSLFPLTKNEGTSTPSKSEVLMFVIQNLCRSLLRHSSVILSSNDQMEITLTRTSMELTQFMQICISDHEDIIVLMSLCTCILFLMCDNSLQYLHNIVSSIECICKNLNNYGPQPFVFHREDIPARVLLFTSDSALPYPFNNKYELGSFVIYLRYLANLADIYTTSNEKTLLLSPSKRTILENIVQVIYPSVKDSIEVIIKYSCMPYKFKNNAVEETSLLHCNFFPLFLADFIAPIAVDLYLLWLNVIQDIMYKMEMDSTNKLLVVESMETIDLCFAPLLRPQISNQVAQSLMNYLVHFNPQASSNKGYVTSQLLIAKNQLAASLVVSHSLIESTTFLSKLAYSFDSNLDILSLSDSNWLRVLSSFCQAFSTCIAPFLILLELLRLPSQRRFPLQMDSIGYLSNERIELARSCAFQLVELTCITMDKASSSLKRPQKSSNAISPATQDQSVMLTVSASNQRRGVTPQISTSSLGEVSGPISSLDKQTWTTFSNLLLCYRRHLQQLLNCLFALILTGSKEHILVSLSAWESIGCALRLTASCLPKAHMFLMFIAGNQWSNIMEPPKYEKVDEELQRSYIFKLPDIGSVGLINTLRYVVWSVVDLGKYPEQLYLNDGNSDHLLLLMLQKKHQHLRTRESVRDALRNMIYFPHYYSRIENMVNVKIDNDSSLFDMDIPLPLYSFQLFLKDVFLRLNGYYLYYCHDDKILKLKKTDNLSFSDIQLVVNLEAILHAFSAVLKRGFSSYQSDGKYDEDSGKIADSCEDHLKRTMNETLEVLLKDEERSIEQSMNGSIPRSLPILSDNTFIKQLFDANLYRIFEILHEMESDLDHKISSSTNKEQGNKDSFYRQLLCTLITLMGVSSMWFNRKPKLFFLKCFKFVFKSLRLPQEDLLYPLALEQDHVGAVALLKLSYHRRCCNSDILNFMISNSLDLFYKLFSTETASINTPTMTLESYLIVLASLGIGISHFLLAKDVPEGDYMSKGSIDANDSTGEIHSELCLYEWKMYVKATLEKYSIMYDNIIEFLQVRISNQICSQCGHYKIPNYSNGQHDILVLLYLLLHGLEVLISSIFPSKLRPYSYAMLTIGADKFDHNNILDYCQKSHLHNAPCGNEIWYESSNYITKIFLEKFYPKIRIIIHHIVKISPNWFSLLYHPYSSLLSCVIQLPRIYSNQRQQITDLFNIVGYDEFKFLSNDVSIECFSSNCRCANGTHLTHFQNNFGIGGSIIINKRAGVNSNISSMYQMLLESIASPPVSNSMLKSPTTCLRCSAASLNHSLGGLVGGGLVHGIKNISDSCSTSISDSSACICNLFPCLILPISVMIIRLTFIEPVNNLLYIKPVLSCINSLGTFSVPPIMRCLIYYGASYNSNGVMKYNSVSGGMNFGFGNSGYNYDRHYLTSIQPISSVYSELDKLVRFCQGFVKAINQDSFYNSIQRNKFQCNHCCSFEYHDGLCLILLLYLQHIHNYFVISSSSKDLSDITKSSARLGYLPFIDNGIPILELEVFIEYLIARCVTTLVIGVGQQQQSTEHNVCKTNTLSSSSTITSRTTTASSTTMTKSIVSTQSANLSSLSFNSANNGGMVPGTQTTSSATSAESAATIRVVTNQRWVVVTLRYLFGEFYSLSKVNSVILERILLCSVWGTELLVTIFTIMMDPNSSSESFSVITDILFLIRQILDVNSFKQLLEMTLKRIPVRYFLLSYFISPLYPYLYFPSLKSSNIYNQHQSQQTSSPTIQTISATYANNRARGMISHNDGLRIYVNGRNSSNTNSGISFSSNSCNNIVDSSSPVAQSIKKSIHYIVENSFWEVDASCTRISEGSDVQLPSNITIPPLSPVMKHFIQLLCAVPVTQSSKAKFRQVLKEYCIRPTIK
ncbi:hypothetical protein ACR3K2_28270 [Cryptosporidium serpentis]